MKVQELLMSIRNKEFNMEKRLEVKKYLPIEVKKNIAQGIIFDCTSEENGVIKIDSVEQYLSYVRYMITTHTNLEYTDEDYDVLCSTYYGDLTQLNALMQCFNDDAAECTRILKLMIADYMQNNSIQVLLGSFLHDVSNSIKGISGKLEGVIENDNLKKILSDDNIVKLKKFLV